MSSNLMRRGGLVVLALLTLAAVTPSSARAEGKGHWRWERGHHREWERPPTGWFAAAPVYVRPAPVYIAPPARIYAPPPVVYAPPPSVSFVFPLSFR